MVLGPRSVVSSVFLLIFISSTGAPTALAAEEFKVDGVHSSVIFRVKHNNVSYFYGRFNEVAGTFRFDDEKPERSAFQLEVKADSVDTHSPNRDNHLKSPDFLNAKERPSISFNSTSVRKTGDDTFEVTGDLTLRGVTKPITVNVERSGTATNLEGTKIAGFESVFTIKRSEFGMDYALGALGDEVRLMFGVEGAAK